MRVDIRTTLGGYRLAWACGLALALLPAAPAWSGGPSEAARLKAAFVFNFSRYTEWPDTAFASTEAALHLCVLRLDSDVGMALAALAGNRVRGREIKVLSVLRSEDLSNCHLLYFEPGVGSATLPVWLDAGKGRPLLTIGEGSGFASQGGMIGLVWQGARLGFEVNLAAARRAELRMSSQLLALARIVKERQEGRMP